jgi:hypothetical protein
MPLGAIWKSETHLFRAELECVAEVAELGADAGQQFQPEPLGAESQDRRRVVDGMIDEPLFGEGRDDTIGTREPGHARDEDGVSHGLIRVSNEGASHGFNRFLRQRGADEGDILIAEFDLTKDVTLLRLGDDELLEEMSPEV